MRLKRPVGMVRGKTKPAKLLKDNDDGTWDVEYLGGEAAKVKESQMKRVLGSQQRQIDQAKAAEKKAGGASKTAAGDLSNADPNDFKAGDLDSSKPVEDKPSKASTSTGRTSLARSTSRETLSRGGLDFNSQSVRASNTRSSLGSFSLPRSTRYT